MTYISTSKLEFIIETLAKNAVYDLNSAQLQGLFKEEHFCLGQIDIIRQLSNYLNLKFDIDKFKI